MTPALLLAFALLSGGAVPNPLTDKVLKEYRARRRDLISAAEAMPEKDYDYRPTRAERSFGDWIAHSALGNYSSCAMIKGEPEPDTRKLEEMSGKANLLKTLRDSFAYCDAALNGMNDKKALSEMTVENRKVCPVGGMITLIAGASEHYGILVEYLKSKGIEPPAPAPRGRLQIPEEHKQANQPERRTPSATPPTFPK